MSKTEQVRQFVTELLESLETCDVISFNWEETANYDKVYGVPVHTGEYGLKLEVKLKVKSDKATSKRAPDAHSQKTG